MVRGGVGKRRGGKGRAGLRGRGVRQIRVKVLILLQDFYGLYGKVFQTLEEDRKVY